MKERIFIKEAVKSKDVEDYIKQKFADAKCSDIVIQRTPLGTRIVIHTVTPGLIIGRKGINIQEITEEIKEKFGIKNPQIDVQRIENPDLDPNIVAQNIAAAIEKGINYKKLGNFYASRIMEAGAIGCEIVMRGKLSGERGRIARFTQGYIKKCGQPAEENVAHGFAVANPKLGNCGITVSIMLRPVQDVIIKNSLPSEKRAGKAEMKKSEKEREQPKTEEQDIEQPDNDEEKTKESKPEKKPKEEEPKTKVNQKESQGVNFISTREKR